MALGISCVSYITGDGMIIIEILESSDISNTDLDNLDSDEETHEEIDHCTTRCEGVLTTAWLMLTCVQVCSSGPSS